VIVVTADPQTPKIHWGDGLMIRMECVKGVDGKNAVIAKRPAKKRWSCRGTALSEAKPQHSITVLSSFTRFRRRFTATAGHPLQEMLQRLYLCHLYGPRREKRGAGCPNRNKLYGYRTFKCSFVFGCSAPRPGFRRDWHGGSALYGGPARRFRRRCAR
jgi:hypothetical protein